MSQVEISYELAKVLFEQFVLSRLVNDGECFSYTKKDGEIKESWYGQIMFQRQQYFTHRIAYAYYNGGIDKDLVVRHLCHNRVCCRKEHLAIGKQRENVQDSIDRGTFDNRGTKNGMAMLNEDEVRQIKELLKTIKVGPSGKAASGELRRIADRFGMTVSTISAIKNGRQWQSVGKPVEVPEWKAPPKKIRNQWGENNPSAVITQQVADGIKLELSQILRLPSGRAVKGQIKMIASKFNVSEAIVKNIASGKAWA